MQNQHSTAITCDYVYGPEIRKISETSDQVVFSIFVPENLIYFVGHFREAPILAGVVQIKWAVELADGLGFCKSEANPVLSRLKFTKLIFPNNELQLTLTRLDGGFSFLYEENAKACSCGRVTYG